ncbi:hypothetical protein [Leptolyngbya ohadii]|uniref:hypothetical protein n=1 Tax=Leptolyngbya ohadii TaxID=1962290 RepID=UPI0015C686AE|nr:hypothetical protein [Leptolyngbya ohadii]
MLAIGCDDFLPKPFDQAVLLEKLAEHLEIEYVYTNHWMNDRLSSMSFSLADLSLPSLTAEQLKVMPIAWIEQLYQFCIELNSSAVLTLIDQIPAEHEGLADVLLRKVNEFQFEELMILAEAAQLT